MQNKKDHHILIIDDSEMNRAIFHEIFSEDYTVLEAANGLEGLDIITRREKELSVILVDMVMPEMDGFQLLKILKKKGIPQRIPIFMITADEKKEVSQFGYEMGVIDHIRRPFSFSAVKKRIDLTLQMIEMKKCRENQ